MKNRKEVHGKALDDLFHEVEPVSSLEENNIQTEEKEIVKVEKKVVNKKIQEKVKTTRKTFNIPVDIAEDMSKVLYMNRDIKDNTDLLIIALKKYLSSKPCQELIEEYNTIKGGK